MFSFHSKVVKTLASFPILIAGFSPLFAQDSATEPGTQVVIQRESIKISDPKKYQIAFQLKASPQVELTAEVDGLIRTIHTKPGRRIDQNTEVLTFDARKAELKLRRAAAHLKVAEAEFKSASSSAKELAEARVEAAKADLELAKFNMEKTSVRVPFAGQILRVHVTEGQFVKAGQPLLSFGNQAELTVEIPVDRSQVQEDTELTLRVENKTVQAKVDSIMPVKPEFETLRELAGSVASAKVVFKNATNEFKVGQAVYPQLVPRQTITEIPTVSLSNQKSGMRKVQVVRDNTIRDITVTLLGQVGIERVFVSGAFQPSDEIIVKASQALPDGTQIRPSTVPLVTTTTASSDSGDTKDSDTTKTATPQTDPKSQSTKKKKKSVGF